MQYQFSNVTIKAQVRYIEVLTCFSLRSSPADQIKQHTMYIIVIVIVIYFIFNKSTIQVKQPLDTECVKGST